jgi:protein TonB
MMAEIEDMIAITYDTPPPPPEMPKIPVLSDQIEIVEDDIIVDDDLFINLEDNADLGVNIIDYVEEVYEEEVEEETLPFIMVEQKPKFKGGDANEFSKWVNSRLVYPEIAKENGLQGRVTLSFTIKADGTLSDVKVLRGVDPSLDQEAVRVVKSSPKWTPGKQRDRAVAVSYTFPVIFQLR